MADISDDALSRAYRNARARRSPEGHHPSDAMWEQLALGTLPPLERAAVMDHATTCNACATVLRGIRDLNAEASAFDPGAPKVFATTPHPVRWWMTSGSIQLLAATLVIAVVGVLLYRVTRDDAGSVPPSQTIARAPSPPAWMAALPLDKAAIHVSPDDALVFRSGARGDGPTVEELAAALEPYRADQFAEAVVRLEALRTRFPKSDRVNLYYGVSLLFLNRPVDAVAPLDISRTSALEPVATDAEWYLTIALARAGQMARAAEHADAVCKRGGVRAAAACTAKDALTKQ